MARLPALQLNDGATPSARAARRGVYGHGMSVFGGARRSKAREGMVTRTPGKRRFDSAGAGCLGEAMYGRARLGEAMSG